MEYNVSKLGHGHYGEMGDIILAGALDAGDRLLDRGKWRGESLVAALETLLDGRIGRKRGEWNIHGRRNGCSG